MTEQTSLGHEADQALVHPYLRPQTGAGGAPALPGGSFPGRPPLAGAGPTPPGPDDRASVNVAEPVTSACGRVGDLPERWRACAQPHAAGPAARFLERPYRSTWREQTSTLHLHGVLDELSAPALLDDLLGLLADGGAVLVDLTDVELLSAAGVGVLVAGLTQADAQDVRLDLLAGPGGMAQRILTICGVPHRLVGSALA